MNRWAIPGRPSPGLADSRRAWRPVTTHPRCRASVSSKAPEGWRTPGRFAKREACRTPRQRLGVRWPSTAFRGMVRHDFVLMERAVIPNLNDGWQNAGRPSPCPLPIRWGEGGRRPGEGFTFIPPVYTQSWYYWVGWQKVGVHRRGHQSCHWEIVINHRRVTFHQYRLPACRVQGSRPVS